MKTSRKYFATGIAFLFLLQSSCSTKSKIARYSGDGEIKTMPGGVLQGGGGCIVKFKPIKLNQPNHFVYHFKELPDWRSCLFFTIEDPRSWEDKEQYERHQRNASNNEVERLLQKQRASYGDLKGTLAMSLKDTNGNVVIQFERKLSELKWSRAGLGPWDLYDEHSVTFVPKSGAEYVLEVIESRINE